MNFNSPLSHLIWCLVLGGILIVLITGASGPNAGADLQLYSAAIVAVFGLGIYSLYQVIFREPTDPEVGSPARHAAQAPSQATTRDVHTGQDALSVIDLANTHKRSANGELIEMGNRKSQSPPYEDRRSTPSPRGPSDASGEFVRMLYYLICFVGGIAWCLYQFWMATLGWMK